jgi:hypothetical protein
MTETKTSKGTMRSLMPETAAIVDWLREQLGPERADRIVLGGKLGLGSFRAVEVGPDGVRREFGSFKPTQWPQPKEAGTDGANRVG